MPENSAPSNDELPVKKTEPVTPENPEEESVPVPAEDVSEEVAQDVEESTPEAEAPAEPADAPVEASDTVPEAADEPVEEAEAAVEPADASVETPVALAESVDEPAEEPEAVDESADDADEGEEYDVSAEEEAEDVEDFEEEDAESEAEADDVAAARPASKYSRGDIVEGVVIQTSPTEILVQLDDDIQGIVSGRELARMDRQALDDLEEGRPVLVFVLNPSNRSGQAVLSLTRALEERDWRQAEEYFESQELYEGKVSGYNKGGLIVRFGRVRGFVPASQVAEERRAQAVGDSPMERWGSMIGEDIFVKVVEVDRNRNRLILSERAAAKEVRDQRKADLLEQLAVGDIRKGHVVSLTDFGAFVDLGGADGLVHLTELSWKHVTRPSEIVEVGQEVEVEVISLDPQRRRIGLSMKSLEQDPWERVVSRFQVGQLVKGTVTKLTKFGAFACLDEAPEIEGLIHISELAEHRVGHPREVVKEDEDLTLRIVKIDRVQRRMGLSLKQVDAVDYLEIDLATYDSDAQPALDDIQGEPDNDTADESDD